MIISDMNWDVARFSYKTTNMKSVLLFPFLLLLSLAVLKAQIQIVERSISIVDENALTIDGRFGTAINGKSFQQDVIVTHKGYQYIAFYDSERHVCLARRMLPSGNWNILRFLDYDFKSNDAHNIISLGICPNDGTIHLAFDHHGHILHYKVSKKGLANSPHTMDWDVSAFGPVISELEKGKTIKITYPRFWQTPAGDLQFCYRRGGSGNGDRMMVDYNSRSGRWENTRQVDSGKGIFKDEVGQSESRCSYPNGYDYDSNGKLHTTWVWRESSQGANHDLVYVFSDDHGWNWRNNAGELLPEIPQVNSPGITVQSIPRVLGLMNTHGQAIDSKGRVHVVMYHCTELTIKEAGSEPGEFRWGPQEAKRYHHYWRDTNGEWNHYELEWEIGNRPKIFTDKQDNLILIYGGNPYKSRDGQNREDERQDLIIAMATAEHTWKDWKRVHSVEGPFINEVLGDKYRWQSKGVLSVILQDAPKAPKEPSALKVLDLVFLD